MSEERWVDIRGFEGSYQVSDMGRVRSLTRTLSIGRRVSGKLLGGRVARNGGRRQVNLPTDGIPSWRYVSRLVAEAFVPNPRGLRSVRHKNGDQLDDRAENLEWCDQPTNAAKRWSSERSVPVTRGDGKWYRSMTEAANDMGVSCAAIRQATETGGTCKGFTFSRSRSGGGGYVPEKRYWGNTVNRVQVDGAKVKAVMTSLGVTVRELAERSDVSETKIWRIRSGKARPTPEELARIAFALGVGPKELSM